ncbi:secretory phospholipase A2 receptor-like [Lineus longissimus]|uniref:secretory phospholipase A2 receptor-like n=1 Tax=Lineus longissimus TaxID=88925 RepID=UPI002B4F0B5E
MKATWLLAVLLVLALVVQESESRWWRKKSKPRKAKKAAKKTTLSCKSKEWTMRGAYCYRVFTKRMNFMDAEEVCKDEGGHLASITSEEEFRSVGKTMMRTRRKGYFRGVTRAWVGLLLDESVDPPKYIWTDRTVTKYRPKIAGALGKSFVKELAKLGRHLSGQKGKPGGKTAASKVEAAILGRVYLINRVCPKKASKRFPFICKAEASTCPEGWRQWKKRCYRYFSKPDLTFDDAEKYCKKESGHLASLHNDAEYEMLLHMMKIKSGTTYGWIGVIIDHKQQSWKWTDGSSPGYLPSKSKLDEKPKGANVARLIYHDGKPVGLYDTIRTKKYGFFCKMDKANTTTTAKPKSTTAKTFTK